MIFSILGIAFTYSDNSERIKVGDYSFAETNKGWLTHIGDQQLIISSDPRTLDLSTIPEISLEALNSANKIYFTFNPQESIQYPLAYFDAYLRPRLKNFIIACTTDITECTDLPLITCSNALPTTRVIQIQESNSSSITYNNNCLLIQGSEAEIQENVEKLTLKLLL